MSALFCGLDVLKDSTCATILDVDGKIVSHRRMGNDRIIPYLSEYGVDRIGMESSNKVAPLYRQLRSNRSRSLILGRHRGGED